MHPYLVGAIACTLLFPIQSLAETSTVATLSNAGTLVRTRNPDIAAARVRIREAIGRAAQATRLTNPELETSVERSSSSGEGRVELGLFQKFPVTARLRIAKEISTTSILSAEAEVEEAGARITAEAREIIVRILANRAHRELVREQISLAEKFAVSIENAAAKGEGSTLDAGQARLEAQRLSLQARRLEAHEATLLADLKPLLGIHAGEGLTVAGSLPKAVIPPDSLNPEKRPDYRIAKLAEQEATARIALEQARRYDDMEGGLFVSGERSKDAPVGYDNDAMVGLRIRFALPFWNENKGAIEEAGALLDRRRLETKNVADTIRLEVSAAREEMGIWISTIGEIGDTMLPLADKQTRDAETAFRNGQSDLQTVLRSRAQRLELLSARLDALRNFHLARVRHDAACGKND